MTVKFLNRGFFQRIFGVPATPKPANPQCWSLSEGKITIDLKRAPELETVGGAFRLEGDGLGRRVLVVHGDNGAFYAFHNRCTHIGHRRLDPIPGTGTVQCCSVGKSTYTYDGKKVFGPPTGAIDTFKIDSDGERLIIYVGS
ncbi:MAG: Rieske 2Fe-2S domain-containing protein [Desulfobacterales bacterium]|jgi:nitrite reductase/ring-hydroxylating ferredoxin subunit|nr:Rieske 2Fe-2S domain-containing protein [Desulfobacterales bacterium]